MSGVILEDGVQWEHCNCCGKFVKLSTLTYEQPSEKYRHGRDIGPCCVGHKVDCYKPPEIGKEVL